MESMGKSFFKPPFAAYDIIVYFGMGLFTVPFIDYFIFKPLKIRLPKINYELTGSLTVDIISGLSLLFVIYIIGHAIVYLSGQFIQKPMEVIFGKTSRVVLFSHSVEPQKRNLVFRTHIQDNIRRMWQAGGWKTDLARLAFHLPICILYLLVFRGIFGYYYSRIPECIFEDIAKKSDEMGFPCPEDTHRSRWFSPIRFFIINNCPGAASRMFNFFTTMSLLRSLCFLFLLAIWLQGYTFVHEMIDGARITLPKPERYSTGNDWKDNIPLLILLYGCYLTSWLAYLRFQRRYIEETLYAFAFYKEPKKD